MAIDGHEIYERVGGRSFFETLVKKFYEKIAVDDLLRPMYPESLDMAEKKLFLFIMQRFGGPREYEKLRGHAMLRRRHFKFPIGLLERNQWMDFMIASLEEMGVGSNHELYLPFVEYFSMVAKKMINQVESDRNQQNSDIRE